MYWHGAHEVHNSCNQVSGKGRRRDSVFTPCTTAATLLVGQNVNPTVVQKTLQHSNVATTLGWYFHISNPERLSAQAAFFYAVSETVR
jgi:streptomycin 6-kinase